MAQPTALRIEGDAGHHYHVDSFLLGELRTGGLHDVVFSACLQVFIACVTAQFECLWQRYRQQHRFAHLLCQQPDEWACVHLVGHGMIE